MSDDTETVIRKTWARTIEPVTKVGYTDGLSDGQTAGFQPSFNVGYELGISFGLELGYKEAMSSMLQQRANLPAPQDQRRINCHICTHGINAQENIGNLYNIQKEKNSRYLYK